MRLSVILMYGFLICALTAPLKTAGVAAEAADNPEATTTVVHAAQKPESKPDISPNTRKGLYPAPGGKTAATGSEETRPRQFYHLSGSRKLVATQGAHQVCNAPGPSVCIPNMRTEGRECEYACWRDRRCCRGRCRRCGFCYASGNWSFLKCWN
jgi:hypothetical protein